MADDNPFGNLDDGIPFGSQAEHPTPEQSSDKPKKPEDYTISSGSWFTKKRVSALIRVGVILAFVFYRFVAN